MRLSIFKTLSKEEQGREVARAIKSIAKAREKLDRIGIWHETNSKQAILWKAN